MATSPLRTLTVLLALAAPTLGAQSAPEPARGSVPAPSGATGTLVGWVTDDSTCAPVAGARVTVDGGRDDVTDADGRFAVGGLAPGAHAVRVERAGYSFAERTGVDVPAGSVNDVDVDLVRTDHAGDRSAGAPGDTATVRVDSSGVAVDVSAGVPAPPRVAWTPRRPRQGALVAITLHDSSARWTAALAGDA